MLRLDLSLGQGQGAGWDGWRYGKELGNVLMKASEKHKYKGVCLDVGHIPGARVH